MAEESVGVNGAKPESCTCQMIGDGVCPFCKAKAAELPVIKVMWDAEKQSVNFQFDTTEFKSWDFILGVIEMAKLKAQTERQMMIGRAMQHNAQEHEKAQRQAAADMKLRGKLKL